MDKHKIVSNTSGLSPLSMLKPVMLLKFVSLNKIKKLNCQFYNNKQSYFVLFGATYFYKYNSC